MRTPLSLSCVFSACLTALPGALCSSRIPDHWVAQVSMMWYASLLLSIQADLERFLYSVCGLNCERTGVFSSWCWTTCWKIWPSETYFMLHTWSAHVILGLAGNPNKLGQFWFLLICPMFLVNPKHLNLLSTASDSLHRARFCFRSLKLRPGLNKPSLNFF